MPTPRLLRAAIMSRLDLNFTSPALMKWSFQSKSSPKRCAAWFRHLCRRSILEHTEVQQVAARLLDGIRIGANDDPAPAAFHSAGHICFQVVEEQDRTR